MIKENTPKVSVVMSVYKEPVEWLHESIDSILNQTFSGFEYIIICDNPEYEEGILLLKGYAKKDNRIRLIFNKENIGLTKSLNIGISIAQGDYIARMDADDISEAKRFEKQLDFFESNPDFDFCSTSFSLIDEDGRVIKKLANERFNDISYLFRLNPIGHSTVMFKKSILSLRVPLYNEIFRCEQDVELWSLMLISGIKMKIIGDVLVRYRISPQQVSQKKNNTGKFNKGAVRRNLINSYLLNNHIITSDSVGTPSKMVEQIEENALNTESINMNFIYNILFILYYAMIALNRRYFVDYLKSPYHLLFKLPLRDTCHLFLCFLGKVQIGLLYESK